MGGLAVARRTTQKRLSEVARSVINAPTVIIDSTNRKESTKATGEERRTFDKACLKYRTSNQGKRQGEEEVIVDERIMNISIQFVPVERKGRGAEEAWRYH